MDLNYLYQRHQVSLFMAEKAASEEARRTHREFAERYAASIAAAKLGHVPLRYAW
jgi:hypothetical protein